MDEPAIYCQRCERTNVVRWEHRIHLEDGRAGLWISQTCQDCRLRVLVRDDAYPDRAGTVTEAHRGYRQYDGSVLWL